MPDFNSPASLKAWLDANGGIKGLRRAIDTGRFSGRNKVEAEAWLSAHDREVAARTSTEERALAERSVNAAEVSAKAAQASANWAKWAAIVAVVAAVVSVAQNFVQR